MSQDEKHNSGINPESQAYINASIAAAVKEAVSAVFAGLQPTLKSMALTPETLGAALREANRPQLSPEDIAKKLREERESLKSKEDEAELRRMTAERRANCPHLDKNGRSSINLVHNFPDHQPRGICVICSDWIHPKEWVVAATKEEASKHETHKGQAYVSEAHKDYRIVMSLESMS